MDRETKKIITPIGQQEVVIKTYLTGREKRALTNVFLQDGLDFDPETKLVKGLKYTDVDKAQNLGWETVIVSIGGSTDGLVEKVLDMRVEDFNFVVAEVNKVTQETLTEEKKTI